MKQHYMDYGNLRDVSTQRSYTPRKKIDDRQFGQVYKLTHNGEGNSLSFMDKAFISFTYGGRSIEDFNLIAITINERLERETPPTHEDHVTDYKMLNGQYYWGTHYTARQMTITLATDGMEQGELDDFKNWFRAGQIRELILAEHPNRGIMARISQAPQISMIPFKKHKNVIINEQTVEVTIIEYRGNIQLNFVMDEPFWYAINNIYGEVVEDENGYRRLINKQTDINGNILHDLDEDGYKTVIEDRIPAGTMIDDDMNLSDGVRLIPYNKYKYTLTNDKIEAVEKTAEGEVLINGTPVVNEPNIINIYADHAQVDISQVDVIGQLETGRYFYSGAIAGPLYIKVYNDNETITSIPDNWVQRGCYIPLADGKIKYVAQRENYAMHRFLPVKKGSIITYNKTFFNSAVDIILYNKKTKSFLNYVRLCRFNDATNLSWTADDDYYIRIGLYITQDEQQYFNNINSIITINLITFKEGQELLSSYSSYIDSIDPKWVNDNYLIDVNDPTKGYYIGENSVYTNKAVKSMVQFIEAGIDSTIINRTADQLVVFLYNKVDKSYIDTLFNVRNYTFTQEYYIRWYMITKIPNDIEVENIDMNDYLEIKLYPFSSEATYSRFNYFYSGNAPSYPKLSFSVPIHFNKKGYIDTFNSVFEKTQGGNTYNTLCLESQFKHELKITNPSIFTAYNKVIDILRDPAIINTDLSSLIQMFRIKIDHPVVRDWIIGCINIYKNSFNNQDDINNDEYITTLTNDMRSMLLLYMPYVFIDFEHADIEIQDDDPEELNIFKEIIVDYNYTASNIDQNTKILSAVITHPIVISLKSQNAKFYQWQFSPDKGKTWYLLLDDARWTGTTDINLNCANVVEEDFGKQYRCLVSNDTAYTYTTPIELEQLDTELKFTSYASNTNAYYGTHVTLTWKAQNYESQYTKILYKLSSTNRWEYINFTNSDDPWFKLANNSVLSDKNGSIQFSFDIASEELDQSVFNVEIWNSYTEFNPNPVKATQYNINYGGSRLTVISMYFANLTVSIRNNQTNVYENVENPYSFICAQDNYLQISSNVYNSQSRTYQIFQDGSWKNLPSSNFYTYHHNNNNISYSYNSSQRLAYVRWRAALQDNDVRIRLSANQSYSNRSKYYPDENGFTINKIVSKDDSSITIVTPIYEAYTYTAYENDKLIINVNDPNSNTSYQWYYRPNENSEWTALTGKTEKNLEFTSIAINNAGHYRIVLHKDGAQPYDDSSTYIIVNVLYKIQIINDLDSSITVNCDSDQIDETCSINLTASAQYATNGKWYIEYGGNTQALSGAVNTSAENNTYVSAITVSYTYKFLKTNQVHFWCTFNDDNNGSLSTTHTEIIVNEKQYEIFNLYEMTAKNWNWNWPVFYDQGNGYMGPNFTTSTITVPCTTTVDATLGLIKFSGTPMTETISWETDVNRSGPSTIITNTLKNSYNNNVNSYKTIGRILVRPANENYYWSKIKLNITKAWGMTNGSQYYGIKIKLGYANSNNTVLYERTLEENELTDINIFDEHNTNFDNIKYIHISIKPYFKLAWTSDSRVSLYRPDYNKNPLNSIFNLANSEVGFVVRGQKTYTRNLLTMRSLRSLNTNDNTHVENEILLTRPTAEILAYVPESSSSGTGLYNLKMTDINKFLSVMNNNGKNKVYKFTYDHTRYQEGFWYNNNFYSILTLEEDLGVHVEYGYGRISIDEQPPYAPFINYNTILEIRITYPEAIDLNIEQFMPVSIDCETGSYIISYNYNKILWANAIINDLTDPKEICYLSSLRHGKYYTNTENAGDMILYNNFVFIEQNHFDMQEGKIKPWQQNDKTLCHKVTYDGKVPIRELIIDYKNYYL